MILALAGHVIQIQQLVAAGVCGLDLIASCSRDAAACVGVCVCVDLTS